MTNRYYGVVDNALTSLNGDITSVATTLTVINANVFSGIELPFILTVGDFLTDANMEKMIVTAVDFGTQILTVSRGFQSTAVAHSGTGNGSSVSARVISQHVADLAANSVMQTQMTCYLEHTVNGTGQTTATNIWEDNTKAVKLVNVVYTYSDTVTRLPLTATRIIYKGDGTTTRKTESSSFTYVNQQLTNMTRTVT